MGFQFPLMNITPKFKSKPYYVNVANVNENITKMYCCRECLVNIKYEKKHPQNTVKGLCKSCQNYKNNIIDSN